MACVCAVYQSESAIHLFYTHISSLFHIPSLPPSLSHPSRWSQSMEQISLCYVAASHQLSILHLVVYTYPSHSLTLSWLTLPAPVSSSPFSTSASLFLSCPQVFQNFFFSFLDFIYMHKHIVFVFLFLTYFTLYDRLLSPSTSLQITQFHFFLWLSNIPLYICATSSLSIHLSVDTQVASMSWLLQIELH